MSDDKALQSDVGTPSTSPASERPRRVSAATRVPMSLPQLRLAVPEIPGYYLYWHAADNVQRALRAGYEFVDPEEVDAANFDVAGDPTQPGGSDLGSRISTPAGGLTTSGTPDRLYLMKLPQEFRDADLRAQDDLAEGFAKRLRSGMIGAENDPDRARRYMKAGQHLFSPKSKRGA
jgi:hypothetical protein